MFEKNYNNRNYSTQNHETWAYLYNKQLINLQDKAIPEFLQNLASLKLPESYIPDLSNISNTLKTATGWEVVGVQSLIEHEEFFDMLANKKFPSTTYIRGEDALGISKSPDIFHELFGHVPLLMDERHGHYIQQLGKLGLKVDKKEIGLLQRLYWFSYEMGIINTKNGMKVIGAALLSSLNELTNAFSNNAIIKPFSLIEILRTPYRDDMLQSVYFKLGNFEELFNLLDNTEYIRDSINKAYHMGEYPAPFPVTNLTNGCSIGRCEFIITTEDDEENTQLL